MVETLVALLVALVEHLLDGEYQLLFVLPLTFCNVEPSYEPMFDTQVPLLVA